MTGKKGGRGLWGGSSEGLANPVRLSCIVLASALICGFILATEIAALTTFTQVILYTDLDGRARFRDEVIPLDGGTPQTRLSELIPARGLQLRQSLPGFRSEVHVTTQPQWVFILSGVMEIGLLDGSSRVFTAGEHFYSADTLPESATFDPGIHGHWSRQLGEEPLLTLFVKS